MLFNPWVKLENITLFKGYINTLIYVCYFRFAQIACDRHLVVFSLTSFNIYGCKGALSVQY